MPSYEYRCPDQHITTINRGITEDEKIPACKECGKPTARIHGVAAITFKGTGWAHKDKGPRK